MSSLFSRILGIDSPSRRTVEAEQKAAQQAAFNREQERLRTLRIKTRREATFLATEGKGIAKQAQVTFGDQLDLEHLTPEEQEQRATGRITNLGTGLRL